MTVDFSVPGRPVGGKRPPVNKVALHLADFLTGVLPEHPLAVDDSVGVAFGLDHNDEYGVCGPTGIDNIRRIVTRLLTGVQVDAAWPDIVAWYRSQNPAFDENDPGGPGDGGVVLQDLLAWLVKRGVILGFAKLDPADDEQVKAAMWLFLATYFGAGLQVAQQKQTDAGLWDYVPGSGSWGGHCVVGARYTPDGRIGVATWAEMVDTTPAWRRHCLDEAYVILLQQHVDHSGFRAGFNLPKFVAAWEAITGRRFPVDVAPAPAPGPAAPFPGALVAAVQAAAASPGAAAFLAQRHIAGGAARAAADALRRILAAPRS